MSKPGTIPTFSTSGVNVTAPSGGLRASGWLPSTRPPAQVFNWLAKYTGDWLTWLDANSPNAAWPATTYVDTQDTAAIAAAAAAATAADNALILAREHANARGALAQALTTSTPWHDATITYVSGVAVNPLALAIGTDYVYFAAASGGKIRASQDGVNWNNGTAGSSYTGNFSGVLYAHGTMIFYGASGEIQTCSSSGGSLTMTRRKNGGNAIMGVANNNANSALVAVDSLGHVWQSSVGTSWSDAGALLSSNTTDVAAGYTTGNTDCFIACDGPNAMLSTDNGATWTAHAVNTIGQIFRIVWCADLSKWFTVGKDDSNIGAIWSSPDGITWTRVYTGTSAHNVTVITRVPGGILAADADLHAIFWDGTTIRKGQFASTLNGNRPLVYTYVPDLGWSAVFCCTSDFSNESQVFRSDTWCPVIP